MKLITTVKIEPQEAVAAAMAEKIVAHRADRSGGALGDPRIFPIISDGLANDGC